MKSVIDEETSGYIPFMYIIDLCDFVGEEMGTVIQCISLPNKNNSYDNYQKTRKHGNCITYYPKKSNPQTKGKKRFR